MSEVLFFPHRTEVSDGVAMVLPVIVGEAPPVRSFPRNRLRLPVI